MSDPSPIWEISEPPIDPSVIGAAPLLSRLLALRGVTDAAEARRFLDQGLADLLDPTTFTDLEVAAGRLVQACRSGEKVAVHGDYDVDGVVSTALMVEFLRRMGLEVTASLPHRLRDGYGIAPERVDRFADEGHTLLVVCDCGSTAHAALERARERGLDVVVLDHHRLTDRLPPAIALVNPERDGDHPLCAAGVVFMTLVDLRRQLRKQEYFREVEEPNLKHYMDLVALATVADMVPLAGVNRLLVRHGLTVLAARRRPGIAALLEVADVHADAPMDTSVCGFRLGPRINAAGRLDDPALALELLLCRDRGRAMEIALELDRINQRRRQLEDLVLQEATEEIEADESALEGRALTLMGDGWHPGVLGIVASRLAQRFHRPALLLARDGEFATGSARSIPGIDLVAALSGGEALLERYGGHAAAAGVSLRCDAFDDFRDWFRHEAFAGEPQDAWTPRLTVDAELGVAEVDEELSRQLGALAPHGIGNPEPRFVARDVPVREVRQVRKGAVQLKVGEPPGIAAISFRPGRPADQIRGRIDLVYSFGMRYFRGIESLQIRIHDLRVADDDRKHE